MAKEQNTKTKVTKALSGSKTAKSVAGKVLGSQAPKGIKSFAASVLGNSTRTKKKK